MVEPALADAEFETPGAALVEPVDELLLVLLLFMSVVDGAEVLVLLELLPVSGAVVDELVLLVVELLLVVLVLLLEPAEVGLLFTVSFGPLALPVSAGWRLQALSISAELATARARTERRVREAGLGTSPSGVGDHPGRQHSTCPAQPAPPHSWHER